MIPPRAGRSASRGACDCSHSSDLAINKCFRGGIAECFLAVMALPFPFVEFRPQIIGQPKALRLCAITLAIKLCAAFDLCSFGNSFLCLE